MQVNPFSIIDKQKFAYLDQAIISATNFVTALILARILGIIEFGVFALLFIVLISIQSIQHALFSAPMMVIAPKINDKKSRDNYLFSLNSAQALSCLILSFFVYLLGTLLVALSLVELEPGILLPFALSIFFATFTEWLRRFFFVTDNNKRAFLLDLLKSCIQISLLLLFIYWDMISVKTAYIAIIFSSLISGLFFISYFRIPFQGKYLLDACAKNWREGKYLLPVSLMEWVNLQGFIILASIILGPAAAGAIRAAQNVVGPLNIVYQAVENIFPVEGARHLVNGGKERMLAYFKKVSAQGMIYLGIPCVLLAFFSQPIITMLYGESFGPYYILIIFQLVSLLLGYYYKLLSSLLRVLERTRIIFFSMILGVTIILALTMPMASHYAESGVLLAKILAEVIILIFLIIVIRRQL